MTITRSETGAVSKDPSPVIKKKKGLKKEAFLLQICGQAYQKMKTQGTKTPDSQGVPDKKSLSKLMKALGQEDKKTSELKKKAPLKEPFSIVTPSKAMLKEPQGGQGSLKRKDLYPSEKKEERSGVSLENTPDIPRLSQDNMLTSMSDLKGREGLKHTNVDHTEVRPSKKKPPSILNTPKNGKLQKSEQKTYENSDISKKTIADGLKKEVGAVKKETLKQTTRLEGNIPSTIEHPPKEPFLLNVAPFRTHAFKEEHKTLTDPTVKNDVGGDDVSRDALKSFMGSFHGKAAPVYKNTGSTTTPILTRNAFSGMSFKPPSHDHGGEMMFNLTPASLGSLKISFTKTKEGTIKALVNAERFEAHTLLQNDSQALQDILQEAFPKTDVDLSFHFQHDESHQKSSEEQDMFDPPLSGLNSSIPSDQSKVETHLDALRLLDRWL